MTCEFCGKSQMDVSTFEIAGIKYNACTACCREVDDLSRFFAENLRKAIEEMMKFPGGIKNDKDRTTQGT